jgi:hypothetical protein
MFVNGRHLQGRRDALAMTIQLEVWPPSSKEANYWSYLQKSFLTCGDDDDYCYTPHSLATSVIVIYYHMCQSRVVEPTSCKMELPAF